MKSEINVYYVSLNSLLQLEWDTCILWQDYYQQSCTDMLGMQITSLAGYCNEIRCIIILYGDTNRISYAPTGFVEHKEVALRGCSSQLSGKLNRNDAESIQESVWLRTTSSLGNTQHIRSQSPETHIPHCSATNTDHFTKLLNNKIPFKLIQNMATVFQLLCRL